MIFYYAPAVATVPSLSHRRHVCDSGHAQYFDVVAGGKVARAAAWSYPQPTPGFASLRDHIAFYPSKMVRRLSSPAAAALINCHLLIVNMCLWQQERSAMWP